MAETLTVEDSDGMLTATYRNGDDVMRWCVKAPKSARDEDLRPRLNRFILSERPDLAKLLEAN